MRRYTGSTFIRSASYRLRCAGQQLILQMNSCLRKDKRWVGRSTITVSYDVAMRVAPCHYQRGPVTSSARCHVI